MARKMNPEVKALWLKGLRSDEYTQTTRVLKCKEGVCCLGLLTDLYIKSPANTENFQWKNNESDASNMMIEGLQVFDSDSILLPQKVMYWAGLTEPNGAEVNLPGCVSGRTTLSGLNDSGYTFAKIADVIEAQL